MATCMYCGEQIADGLKFCPNCGAALPVEAPQVVQPEVLPASDPGQQQWQQPGYQQQANYGTPAVNDSGSIGWGILGFFFPLVGLILFLVWKSTKPKCAKVAGIGAIVGFVLGLLANMGTIMAAGMM